MHTHAHKHRLSLLISNENFCCSETSIVPGTSCSCAVLSGFGYILLLRHRLLLLLLLLSVLQLLLWQVQTTGAWRWRWLHAFKCEYICQVLLLPSSSPLLFTLATQKHVKVYISIYTLVSYARRRKKQERHPTAFPTASLAYWLRRPPRERKVPGSNPACARIFSESSHTSDLNIGTPVATLPGAWR